jgi:hypothetical protein
VTRARWLTVACLTAAAGCGVALQGNLVTQNANPWAFGLGVRQCVRGTQQLSSITPPPSRDGGANGVVQIAGVAQNASPGFGGADVIQVADVTQTVTNVQTPTGAVARTTASAADLAGAQQLAPTDVE